MIWELRHEHTIGLLIEIAGIPRSTYYYYVKHRKDEDKYRSVKKQIAAIFHENKGRYGYRRITLELHNQGCFVNHKTVQRLMQETGLVCKVRMKKYHSYKGEVGKIAPNLLERDFKAAVPNEKWVTDVTEFSLFGQKLYLSPILDLHSSDLVSYTISDRPALSMVMDMVRQALPVLPRGAAPAAPAVPCPLPWTMPDDPRSCSSPSHSNVDQGSVKDTASVQTTKTLSRRSPISHSALLP